MHSAINKMSTVHHEVIDLVWEERGGGEEGEEVGKRERRWGERRGGGGKGEGWARRKKGDFLLQILG